MCGPGEARGASAGDGSADWREREWVMDAAGVPMGDGATFVGACATDGVADAADARADVAMGEAAGAHVGQMTWCAGWCAGPRADVAWGGSLSSLFVVTEGL